MKENDNLFKRKFKQWIICFVITNYINSKCSLWSEYLLNCYILWKTLDNFIKTVLYHCKFRKIEFLFKIKGYVSFFKKKKKSLYFKTGRGGN